MLKTIVLVEGHALPACHHELKNKSVSALQLEEFMDTKMVGWGKDLKEKVAPLEH